MISLTTVSYQLVQLVRPMAGRERDFLLRHTFCSEMPDPTYGSMEDIEAIIKGE